MTLLSNLHDPRGPPHLLYASPGCCCREMVFTPVIFNYTQVQFHDVEFRVIVLRIWCCVLWCDMYIAGGQVKLTQDIPD